MKISKKLNIVIPVESEDGSKIYVHSTPVSREVFEEHFLILSKTFAAIHGEGLGILGGPRVAMLILKKLAAELGDPEAVQKGLINEIFRITNVVLLTDKGWDTMPYEAAVSRSLITPEDAGEVENALAFFIVSSAMHRRDMLKAILPGAATLWGAELTSLNSTEFMNSLRTSTVIENTGETVKPLSVPS